MLHKLSFNGGKLQLKDSHPLRVTELKNKNDWNLKYLILGEICMSNAYLRLFVSLFIFKTSKNQIKVDLVDENFTELRGEIAGPPDTPYEGK